MCRASAVAKVFCFFFSKKKTFLSWPHPKPDGGGPQGQLLYSQGVFYGTTEFGGSGGEGTIFALRP